MSATTGFTSKTKITPSATSGSIQNVVIAVANVEQSITLPADTVIFMMKPRGIGHIKLAHDSGTSGTSYLTIWPGAVYMSPEFKPDAKTIYFQSPVAGLVIEVESWA